MGQYFVYKVEKLSKKQHSLAVSFGGGGFRENGDHPNEGTRTIKQTLAFDTNHRQRTSLEQNIRTKSELVLEYVSRVPFFEFHAVQL